MTAKHAAGGWSYGRTTHGAIHVYDRHGSQIAFVVGRKGQEATGRLIAAAPSMLAALEIADKFCGSLTPDECPDSVHIPIREALAKARGET